MTPRSLAAITLASGMLLPGLAAAQDAELPVAVLTIQTDEAFEQADALTTALKRVVEDAPGWSTVEGHWALQVLVITLNCKDPPDAECEQKIAEDLKVDRFIWGRMQKKGDTVAGDLHMWIKGKGSQATTLSYSSNLTVAADEALVSVAREAFDKISGGVPGGTVRIKAGSVTGEVLVDGVKVGSITNGVATIPVPIGSHRITVQGVDFEPMEAVVDMGARETKDVTLVPGAQDASSFDWKIVGGFSLIGVGLAAGGVAAYHNVRVLQVDSDLDEHRSGTPDGDEICDDPTQSTEAKDLCSDGERAEIMPWVFWPIAGISAGIGVILLATADWGGGETEETALPFRVDPRFGPTGGDVTVTVRF